MLLRPFFLAMADPYFGGGGGGGNLKFTCMCKKMPHWDSLHKVQVESTSETITLAIDGMTGHLFHCRINQYKGWCFFYNCNSNWTSVMLLNRKLPRYHKDLEHNDVENRRHHNTKRI